MLIAALAASAFGQALEREKDISPGITIEIVNHSGRVSVNTDAKNAGTDKERAKLNVSAASSGTITESEVKIAPAFGVMRVEVEPISAKKRIDISVIVPERAKVKVETVEGEVRLAGNLESAQVSTETGTIATDVPVDNIKYLLAWTASRPRFVADFELSEVKEKAAGRFEIKGEYQEKKVEATAGEEEHSSGSEPSESDDGTASAEPSKKDEDGKKSKGKKEKGREPDPKADKRVSLNFTTDRGIVLLNVPPNEVMSDLRERPLTESAKSIIRSSDKVLMEAIRRASPKYFGDYASTLPPARREPELAVRPSSANKPATTIKQAIIRVTDTNNRAITGLEAPDFDITENGETREVLSARPTTAPVNLVLLLDVSGSVDNYVNFIRKAARNFVNSVKQGDSVSIVLFNDDVKVLSPFTTDKQKLSESLDTFDAGGPTAYYDAIGYTLAETLRPLKGERTAIVILTDGDDNRSFLPFDSLIGAIEESGALIYPLYVPSALVAASAANPNATVDPVRMRYSGLSQKAEGEGERLASVSGGVYYPISQLSQIQEAYEDIAAQIRTAYSVVFRSKTAADTSRRASPRLKVKIKKEKTFATIGPVTTFPGTN